MTPSVHDALIPFNGLVLDGRDLASRKLLASFTSTKESGPSLSRNGSLTIWYYSAAESRTCVYNEQAAPAGMFAVERVIFLGLLGESLPILRTVRGSCAGEDGTGRYGASRLGSNASSVAKKAWDPEFRG